MSVEKLFTQIQLFSGLADDELQHLIALAHEWVFPAGEIIIDQNTTGNELYIIAEGAAEVFIQGLSDQRSLVMLGQGEIFGEMALIDQGYRSASVRATAEGCTLYVIACDALVNLCRANTKIGYQVMRNLAGELAFKLRHQNLAVM